MVAKNSQKHVDDKQMYMF